MNPGAPGIISDYSKGRVLYSTAVAFRAEIEFMCYYGVLLGTGSVRTRRWDNQNRIELHLAHESSLADWGHHYWKNSLMEHTCGLERFCQVTARHYLQQGANATGRRASKREKDKV